MGGGERSHAQGHGRDAVSALCMGQHSGSVLLLVGHASGAVRVWELKTQLGGGWVGRSGTGVGWGQAAGLNLWRTVTRVMWACAASSPACSTSPAGGVHFALTKSLAGLHAAAVTAAALLDG